MRKKTVRILLIISGTLLLLTSIYLFAMSIAWIGINDGEWGHISRNGTCSVSHKLKWTEWQPNDGTVTPFRGYRPEVEKPEIAEFRRGHVDGFLFDFTAYEGRAAGADANASFPAIGPNWGTDYNSVWALSAFALGVGMFIAARVLRAPSTGGRNEA